VEIPFNVVKIEIFSTKSTFWHNSDACVAVLLEYLVLTDSLEYIDLAAYLKVSLFFYSHDAQYTNIKVTSCLAGFDAGRQLENS